MDRINDLNRSEASTFTPQTPKSKGDERVASFATAQFLKINNSKESTHPFKASKRSTAASIKERAVALTRFLGNEIKSAIATLTRSSETPESKIKEKVETLSSAKFRGSEKSIIPKEKSEKIARYIEAKPPGRAMKNGESLFISKQSSGLDYDLVVSKERGKTRHFVLTGTGLTEGSILIGKGTSKSVSLAIDYETGKRFVAAKMACEDDLPRLREIREEFKAFQKAAPGEELVHVEYKLNPEDKIPTQALFVIPLASEGDLASVMKSSEWAKEKEQVVESTLKFLSEAHKNQVANRDILVDKDQSGYKAKLTDWGTFANNGEEALPDGSYNYTPGDIKAGGKEWGAHDVFSAGITISEMIKGKKPDWIEKAYDSQGFPTVNYEQGWKGALSPGASSFDHLVHDMTHPDPLKRPTMNEAYLRFQNIRKGL